MEHPRKLEKEMHRVQEQIIILTEVVKARETELGSVFDLDQTIIHDLKEYGYKRENQICDTNGLASGFELPRRNDLDQSSALWVTTRTNRSFSTLLINPRR